MGCHDSNVGKLTDLIYVSAKLSHLVVHADEHVGFKLILIIQNEDRSEVD